MAVEVKVFEGKVVTGCSCDDDQVGGESVTNFLYQYEYPERPVRVTIVIQEMEG